MIRALVLAFGLVAGLMLAVLTEGRHAHLSALPGDRLPEWTAVIAGDASLTRGSAGPLAGQLALNAEWRLARIGLSGPVWRVQISGRGFQLAGDLTSAGSGHAQLRDISGRIDTAALALWEHHPEFDAELQITRASATIDTRQGTIPALQAEGFARNVALGDSALGDGRMVASREADGRWQLGLTLAAGQATVEAEGDALGGILRLHVAEDRPELLPAGWGRPLPSDNARLMVSHLLPIRPPMTEAAQP